MRGWKSTVVAAGAAAWLAPCGALFRQRLCDFVSRAFADCAFAGTLAMRAIQREGIP
jgi:hypothetical protein